jgi:hypothetical protein
MTESLPSISKKNPTSTSEFDHIRQSQSNHQPPIILLPDPIPRTPAVALLRAHPLATDWKAKTSLSKDSIRRSRTALQALCKVTAASTSLCLFAATAAQSVTARIFWMRREIVRRARRSRYAFWIVQAALCVRARGSRRQGMPEERLCCCGLGLWLLAKRRV